MGDMQVQLQIRPVLWLPGSDTFSGFQGLGFEGFNA